MIISSIDIMNGKAVQLRLGREKVLERDDIPSLAQDFDRFGEIAVIDLDQALDRGHNCFAIKPVLALGECRVGGGVRSVERAREWVSWGARKVIVGTAAFAGDRINHGFLKSLKEAIGRQRIIVAVDSRNGEIVTCGWGHQTGIHLLARVQELEEYCAELLFTCVEREGTMRGTDLEAVKKLRQATALKLTVAGGVSCLGEVEALAGMGCDVQLGMALYTGKIDLACGFVASLHWPGNGLVPTITRDEKGNVLMLAWSSRESLQQTLIQGRMWYYSRSKKRLWMKGETSGHVQDLVRIRADCDRDALLATVRQKGAACHTGDDTCFGQKPFTLNDLEEVIRDRLQNPNPGSYTASLTETRVREKLMEEAGEVVAAEKREDVIWEAADVLYFLLVCLARKKIGLSEVMHELQRRRRK